MIRTDSAGLRYLLVGGANTLMGLLVIYGAKLLLGLGEVAANAAGYAVGVGPSFVLNQSLTFQFTESAFPALFRFLVVLGVAYLANLLTVLLLISLDVDSRFAQAIGVIPYT